MAITEAGRHRMYGRFEEIFGNEVATMLMEHLPPVGWADVATKRDLDHLAMEVRLELSELRTELHRELRLHTLALLGGFAAINGITAGLVVGLLG